MILYSKENSLFHIILILIVLCFAGCTLLQLSKETERLDYSTILVGYITVDIPYQDAPVVVAAYTKNDGKRNVIHYVNLHEAGPYELLVPEGDYYLVAFIDKNTNLKYDEGEYAGQYNDTETVLAESRKIVPDLDILISDSNSQTIDLPVGTKMPSKKYNQYTSTVPGAVANLDEEIFSNEYGKMGYWTPLEFFLEIGGNIYFLEPYDSGKIPILFVHGAAGSPQNWRYFINHINQEKYQACFYYYPSGAPIEAISYLLYWKLFNLQRKYHFKKMHIVAHSMGGLVVRSCLVNWGEQFPFINDFVSISTPWGGQNSAELGVEYSPVIIPAWKDLEPDGNFIKSLYQKKLPESVQSYLFFGYKGNRNPFSTNNDKVVSLASELDQRAQKDAEMVFGFNEDHMSILSSDQVMRQFNTIIDYNAENDMIQQLSGKLQINFEFDSPDDLIKPRPRLLLRSTEYLNNEHIIYLRNKDSGKVLGPFPVGKYKVSLIADAFYPEPVSLLIDIKPDTVTTLSFKLNPRGSLLGRIINANEPQIQPFINRESNQNIKIKKITLSGNNIHRIIYPDKHDADQNKFDNYLSGTDCLIDACFYFYKLPAGVYTLTINAKGFKTFTAKYDVIPGQTYKTNTIELVPISEN